MFERTKTSLIVCWLSMGNDPRFFATVRMTEQRST
jgi:hypothetical protein